MAINETQINLVHFYTLSHESLSVIYLICMIDDWGLSQIERSICWHQNISQTFLVFLAVTAKKCNLITSLREAQNTKHRKYYMKITQ